MPRSPRSASHAADSSGSDLRNDDVLIRRAQGDTRTVARDGRAHPWQNTKRVQLADHLLVPVVQTHDDDLRTGQHVGKRKLAPLSLLAPRARNLVAVRVAFWIPQEFG